MYDKLEAFRRARQARYRVVDLAGAITAQDQAAAGSAEFRPSGAMRSTS